jgi:predicted deacylase
MHSAESIKKLLNRLQEAGQCAGFRVEQFGQIDGYSLLAMTRPALKATDDAPHTYISAGIHGDEPAGPQAILELLEAQAFPLTHSFSLCPLLNPAGMAAGLRENPQGIDLNRDYGENQSPEIRAHSGWITKSIPRIDRALHLHEDWESEGFYLYELNFTGTPGLAAHLLAAARTHLPIETATEIDGRNARDGVIRPDTLPEIEEGDPEAIFIQKQFGGLNYTLETPSSADFRKRVDTLKAAVQSAIS